MKGNKQNMANHEGYLWCSGKGNTCALPSHKKILQMQPSQQLCWGKSCVSASDFTKKKQSNYELTLEGQGAEDRRGNSGRSRALVKHNGPTLVLNYQNDYSNGVRVDSTLSVKGPVYAPKGMSTMTDTRNRNDPPSYYRARVHQLGIRTTEFKSSQRMDMNDVGFVVVDTIVPWPDPSGGAVKQIMYSDYGMAYRVGTLDDQRWQPWIYLNSNKSSQVPPIHDQPVRPRPRPSPRIAGQWASNAAQNIGSKFMTRGLPQSSSAYAVQHIGTRSPGRPAWASNAVQNIGSKFMTRGLPQSSSAQNPFGNFSWRRARRGKY
jgi:hypothetical protein